MRNMEKPVQKTSLKSKSKAKTRYIVTHEYAGNLSMQTAFHEVIEHKVCDKFEQWKEEKLTE